jgi:hypothetical protein
VYIKENKKNLIFRNLIQPWHLLQDDFTVLAGSLSSAGAIVVPLGQLAGIGHGAGEGLRQPDRKYALSEKEENIQL